MVSIFDPLRDWLRERSRSTEAGSDPDGFLSYSGEWHAVAVGAVFGLLTAITGHLWIAVAFAVVVASEAKVPNDHLRDARKEVAYSGGAYVAVYVLASVAGTL